jgi:hypothetical protein
MAQTAPKLFRRESGQIQAVTEESKQILEITKAFVDKVKSDPPPALKKNLPPGAGLYKATPLAEHVVVPLPRAAVPRPDKAPASEKSPVSEKAPVPKK